MDLDYDFLSLESDDEGAATSELMDEFKQNCLTDRIYDEQGLQNEGEMRQEHSSGLGCSKQEISALLSSERQLKTAIRNRNRLLLKCMCPCEAGVREESQNGKTKCGKTLMAVYCQKSDITFITGSDEYQTSYDGSELIESNNFNNGLEDGQGEELEANQKNDMKSSTLKKINSMINFEENSDYDVLIPMEPKNSELVVAVDLHQKLVRKFSESSPTIGPLNQSAFSLHEEIQLFLHSL